MTVTAPHARIKHVTIVGGTHGNEITGVHCIQHCQQHPEYVHRDSFQTHLLLGNPAAIQANRRFIDKDLNRCFSAAILENAPQSHSVEIQRAHDLKHTLCDTEPATDFIIDLHTSTANMGVSLIFTQTNHLMHRLLQHVAKHVDAAHFMHEPLHADLTNSHYLISCAPQSLLIEVGPIAQGLLKAQPYIQMLAAIHATLDAIHEYNLMRAHLPHSQLSNSNPADWTLPVYQAYDTRFLPQHSDGAIQGMVHPALQDCDYQLLEPGMPEFYHFTGESTCYDGEPCYPVFINEAAYYPSAQAYSKTRRLDVNFDHPVTTTIN
ncbi:MAG: aspartoacylase [Gammaproteobacteria bacterium]